MKALEQLRREALVRRNASILLAREQYRETLECVKLLERKAKAIETRKPRKRKYRGFASHGGDFSKMTTRQAAELVLRDSGPLRLVELTVNVMQLGCRTDENPRTVANSIRCSLLYHAKQGRFFRDEVGRWSVCNSLVE